MLAAFRTLLTFSINKIEQKIDNQIFINYIFYINLIDWAN